MENELDSADRAAIVAEETDPKRKLLDYARKVAMHAELVGTISKHLAKVSRDGARRTRRDIREAIVRLRAFEQSLSDRIGEGRHAAGQGFLPAARRIERICWTSSFEAKGEDAVREDIAARRYGVDRRRVAIDRLDGLARARAEAGGRPGRQTSGRPLRGSLRGSAGSTLRGSGSTWQAKHDAWHAERDSQKLKIERLQTAS